MAAAFLALAAYEAEGTCRSNLAWGYIAARG